eukprot:1466945-Pleurochrysis_carterae.AAC.1
MWASPLARASSLKRAGFRQHCARAVLCFVRLARQLGGHLRGVLAAVFAHALCAEADFWRRAGRADQAQGAHHERAAR